jgi:ribosome-associated heat shock protein Hsp15
MEPAAAHPHPVSAVRLDKWLWAARFYKTRSLAKVAIEAGHVRYGGERAKVAKDVAIGAVINVRRGHEDLEVVVVALSDHRGGAPLARLLYEETVASMERRTREAEERRAAHALISPDRPTKQQRRQIHRFKRALGGQR